MVKIEEGKVYTLADIRAVGFNLEPCRCKFCGSTDTVYLQGVDALACEQCGEMEE